MSIAHYTTSNSNEENFKLLTDISFSEGDRYTNININELSFHSIVYTIDSSVLDSESNSTNDNTKQYSLIPNPVDHYLSIKTPENENHKITIYQINGKEIYKTESDKNLNIDVSFLKSGVYLIKIESKGTNYRQLKKFIKK